MPNAAEAALPDQDPVLDAWRAWRPLEEKAAHLIVERDRIGAAIPEEARSPWIRVDIAGVGERPFWRIGGYDSFMKVVSPRSRTWMRKNRPVVIEQFRQRELAEAAELDRSGWTVLNDRIETICELQRPHYDVIKGSTSSAPVTLVAQLDLGLSYCEKRDAWLDDLPHAFTCGVIRNLLPQLPPDMAEALAPIAIAEGRIRDAYLRGAAAEIGGAA